MPDNNQEKDNIAQNTGADKSTGNKKSNNVKEAYSAYREAKNVNNSSKRPEERGGDSSKKAAKTAAKAAANYFAPGVGGKAVDLASKTKVGDAVLNKGAQALNRIPGMAKTLKKADQKGALDKADKAADMMGGGKGGASKTPNGTNPINKSDDKQKGDSGSNPSSKKPSPLSDLNPLNKFKNKNPFSIKGLLMSNNILVFSAIFLVPILFFMLIIVSTVSAADESGSMNDGLGVSQSGGGGVGGINYEASSPEAQAFYDRVNEVKNDFQSNGKSFDALYIAGFYSIVKSSGSGIDYDDMTKGKIEEIANAMFPEGSNSFDEDTFKENLKNSILPDYLSNGTKEKYDGIIKQIFQYVENYKSIIGDNTSICAASGTCVYNIKGFSSGNTNYDRKITVNNLMVRLMESGDGDGHNWGGEWEKPMVGEDLVPFEDYVLGVAFGEIGTSYNDEAIKANLIMARSYALARPSIMNNSGGKKLEEENGKWILQMCSSTADHVYCNPDKGCSATPDCQWGMVYSGFGHGTKCKGGETLAQDAKMRALAAEVQGEVLVDNEGYIYYTNYASTEQNRTNELAAEGKNYKQILLEMYSGASDIQKMNCNNGSGNSCTGGYVSTGPYSTWKQYGASWSSIPVGRGGNIQSIGCAATSIAMLIAKSGVATNVDGQFNPGTFVQKLNSTGGFDSSGNITWSKAADAAPNFNFAGDERLSGSKQQKTQKIKSLLDKGYYVLTSVNYEGHWVAVDAVNGDNVIMMDPGSPNTNLWSQYTVDSTTRVVYYKVS